MQERRAGAAQADRYQVMVMNTLLDAVHDVKHPLFTSFRAQPQILPRQGNEVTHLTSQRYHILVEYNHDLAVEVVVAPSLLTEGKVYQKAQRLGMGK